MSILRIDADLDMWKLLVKCSKQVRQDDGTRDQIDIDIQCTSKIRGWSSVDLAESCFIDANDLLGSVEKNVSFFGQFDTELPAN